MKISIITPSHKTKYLNELEESLINQTYDNWEWILLLNNGVVYTPNNLDDRIKIINLDLKTNSVGALKKIASDYATGEVIAEVDHDDFLTKNCLFEVANAYAKDDDVGFVYSKTIYLKENGDFIPYDKIHGWEYDYYNWNGENLIVMNELPLYPGNLGYIVYSPNHIRTWKKDIYDEIGGHNKNLEVCDDQDLMIRLYQKTKFKYIDKPLYFYRITGDNTWIKNGDLIHKLTNDLYKKNIVDLCLRYCKLKNLKDVIINEDDASKLKGISSDSIGLVRFNAPLKRNNNTIDFLEQIHRILHPGGMFLCEYELNNKEYCTEEDLHQFLYERNNDNRLHSISPNLFWFRERGVKTEINLGLKKIKFHVMKDLFKNQKRLSERKIKEINWLGDKLEICSGWNGLENYIKPIIEGFNINPRKMLEFGVEYGYSTHIFSQLFEKVVGVDTFEGDIHAGFKNLYDEVKNRFENTNVKIIKSDFRDYIEDNDDMYDLIHVDIVHTYEDTYEAAEWAIKHSKVVILHDTISFSDINRVCVDLSNKHILEYYNITKYNGLGILYNPNLEKPFKPQLKKINIFYHCHAINHWKELFEKTYDLIENTKLIDVVDNIFVNFDGYDYDYFKRFNKINLIKNKNKFKSEATTLWLMQNYAKNNEGYSLYLHGKGVVYSKNIRLDWNSWVDDLVYEDCYLYENVGSWFDYMLHYNVEMWEECVKKLDEGYDTTGVQLYENPSKHYSGNIWWANNNYIKNLAKVGEENRCDSEAWIGSGGNPIMYNFIGFKFDFYVSKKERYEYTMINNPNKFSVIIPTLWRSNVDLIPMLKTYEECHLIDEVIIINNNVSDTPIIDNSKKIKILNQEDNIFVNPSWNLGAEEAKNKFLLIINDDIFLSLFDLNVILLGVIKTLKEGGNIIGVAPFEIPEIENKYEELTKLDYRRYFTTTYPANLGSMFFLRKSDYIPIPEDLKIGYGDIILFQKLNPYVYTFDIQNKTNTAKDFTELCSIDSDTYFNNYKKINKVVYLGNISVDKLSVLKGDFFEDSYVFIFADEIEEYKEVGPIIYSPTHKFNFFRHLNFINTLLIYNNVDFPFEIDQLYIKNVNLLLEDGSVLPYIKSSVYDCFTFFNELDLLEIRLNYLNDVVDYFVLVEADKTHSGEPKPYYYEENKERFKEFHHKIIHIKKMLDTDGLTFEKSIFENMDKKNDFWKLENEQRDAIMEGLIDAKDNDVILIGDLDEIPKKEIISEYIKKIKKTQKTLMMKNYMYYLNNSVSADNGDVNVNWWGTCMLMKRDINTPQEVRDDRFFYEISKPIYNGGWHFTFLGGVEKVLHKLKSYAHSEYNNETFLDEKKIDEFIKNGYDFQNSGLKYEIIDINEHKDDYPDYLVNNLNKYKHLIN